MTVPIVWMFSGQGSQYFQMGRELYANDRCFKEWMNRQDEIARPQLGISLTEMLYTDKKISDPFELTRYTHPAIFMVQYALAQVLLKSGLTPDYVVGNSLGECVAATVVGVMDYEEALRSVIKQAQVLEARCGRGAMIAVLDDPHRFASDETLNRRSELAAINYDRHFVLSGERDAILEIETYLKEQSILHQVLPVSAGFHSASIDPAKADFLACVNGQNYAAPTLPFVSCTSASATRRVHDRYFWDVIREPIEFQKTVGYLEDKGSFIYVDLGPSGTLAGFVKKNLKNDSQSKSLPILTLFGRDIKNLEVVKEHIKNGKGASSARIETRAAVGAAPAPERKRGMLKTFIFPGQGSQMKGMGGALFDRYPDLVRKADAILGYSIKELCLHDPGERLNRTQYTQPALYVVNALTYRKTIDEAREPDYLAGHSLGEYNALWASGAVDFESGLRIVQKRGELMSAVSGGGMAAAIGAAKETIEDILKRNDLGGVDIANYNSPTQIVISGLKNDIDRAGEVFRKENIMLIPLNVSAAFHSRYMQGVKNAFEEFLRTMPFSALKIPVIANVTARPYLQAEVKKNIVEQITGSVKWTDSISYLLGLGEMEFQEIGPGNVLTKLVAKIRQEATPPLAATANIH